MSSFTHKNRMPVSLRQLLPHSSFVGCADIRVTDVTEKSGDCRHNTLFAAIPGTNCNGLDHVGQAITAGAQALLVPHPLAGQNVPQCVTTDIRKSFGKLCSAIEDDPSRKLKIAATTGTNGKTTTAWLIRSILQAAGRKTGCLGTIEYSDGQRSETSKLTTPDARSLSNWLARMVDAGSTHASIELSSHALAQHRAAGTLIDTAIVTNITQDHYDYHGNAEHYFESKSQIVEHLKPGGLTILNADDAGCQKLQQRLNGKTEIATFGIDGAADIRATAIQETLCGSRFLLQTAGLTIEMETTLIGRHNILNCLAATAAARHFGIEWADIADGIANLQNVPGRLERVATREPLNVFVDYAHTDDALRRSLTSLKEKTLGRLICVFGAGGCRDQEKRPLLGQAASLADIAVVTSDNPRDEEPTAIIDAIVEGIDEQHVETVIEPNRFAAIEWAIDNARDGDTVLIAGKGHETEQIVGSKRLPFDDREVATEALARRNRTQKSIRIQIPA